jgi:AraC-like DNA-binding protein
VPELFREPIGSLVAGRSVIVWVQTPSRFGAVHRSPLDVADASTLAMLAPLPLHPSLVPPFDMLHDLSAVDVVDQRAFEWAESYLEQWIGELAARARRLAVVRPTGLAGATFTGIFHEWVSPRFDAKLCQQRSEAHDWLDIDASARREIDEIHDSFTYPPLIRRLREALARDLQEATVERIAGQISISDRSLQRQLSAHGTTFSDELARARIRAAEAMLFDGSEKIETIALMVGFRSAAAFTTMFRRVNGEAPGAFRNRALARRAKAS